MHSRQQSESNTNGGSQQRSLCGVRILLASVRAYQGHSMETTRNDAQHMIASSAFQKRPQLAFRGRSKLDVPYPAMNADLDVSTVDRSTEDSNNRPRPPRMVSRCRESISHSKVRFCQRVRILVLHHGCHIAQGSQPVSQSDSSLADVHSYMSSVHESDQGGSLRSHLDGSNICSEQRQQAACG